MLVDEKNDSCDALLDQLRLVPVFIPSLFWFEIRNLLLMAERRGRISPGGTNDAMAELRILGLQEATSDDDEFILKLARRHSLSAYDAKLSRIKPRAPTPNRNARQEDDGGGPF